MLAFKVHKDKNPNIRGGSFWIPIVDWGSARIHLRNWYKTLSQSRRIRHLTLVHIPKNHPVFVGVDFTSRFGCGLRYLPFVPLKNVEPSILHALKPLDKALSHGCHHVGQGFFILGSAEAGRPLAGWPELILGADLPRSCIKWTKDIRLLIRGDKRSDRASTEGCGF